jgi:hypothetical protein
LIRILIVAVVILILWSRSVGAQAATAPGFVEIRGVLFPQTAANDTTREVADALWRQEGFLRPARWLQLVAGVDLRANTHDQVEDVWRIDWEDRHLRPPRISIRRLAATINAGRLTLDLGKQLIRWARADVLNPIDRFAPRDFLNVIDAQFFPVIAARASLQVGPETFEAVWVPQLTPSRMPLLTQRWTVLPPLPPGTSIVDAGSRFPRRSQAGGRWRHTGGRFETGLSYFDGFNHLPRIDVRALDESATVFALTRVFPRIRTYGADVAVPTPWLTFKGEAAYFVSPQNAFAEYGLYVAEIERQIGEWLLIGGYAGEVVTREGRPLAFDPERSLARSIIVRASYTVDPRRSIAIEAVGRQSGEGYYLKADYSQAVGEFWRITLTQIVLAGEEDDFLGQFNRNSHFSAALRLSF